MTTLIYRGGVLAADTAITDSDTLVARTEKIVKDKRGRLAGAAGSFEDSVTFLEWFRSGAKGRSPKAITDRFEGLLIHSYDVVEWFGCDGKRCQIKFDPGFEFTAIGSGFKVALGAMSAGASAEQAIRIACRLDVYTSEPVTILRCGKGN